MPSTFTTSCRFELQETGTNLNQWGVVLNARAIAMIDQAVDGYQSIDLASGATFDLSSATYTKNGESDTSRRRVLRFTNSNSAGTAITIPSVTKNYWIVNGGSYPITFAPSGSLTPASVPSGTSAFIWTDGTDCFAFRPRLNELVAPNGSVAMGSQKITGLADGSADTDAVNKLQVTTLTAASVQLANDWAQKVSDFVTASDNSAKSWAIGGTGNGQPTAGDAKSWATSTSTVAGGLKGARGYASDASTSAGAASTSAGAASTSATNALNSEIGASTWATSLSVVSGGFKGARGYAVDAAAILADFENKYVNNAGAGTFPASGNFSGRVAWSGSAFGVYNGSGWDALTSTPAASESVAGIIEIATQTETNTGTDDNRAVTPKKLKDTPLTLPKNIQSVAKTDTFTTTSTSWTDLTGLSVSITPSSASSRILIFATINGTTTSAGPPMAFKVLRGSTDVLVGDSAGSRTRAQAALQGALYVGATLMAVDSPATTSSTTYKIQCMVGSAGTGYINRNDTDNDVAARMRTASTLIVMEIQ